MSNYTIPSYFTPDQQQAVLLDKTNILVSAAAGCGKTTLMVERIIRKIVQDQVAIDTLIVVTFTESAAAELKQRLEIALSKQLELDPSNEFLKHQISILNDSYIMTFHALCFRLLKENNAAFAFNRPLVIADSLAMMDIKQKAYHNLLNNHFQETDFKVLDDYYNTLISNQPLFETLDKTLELCITKGSIESFIPLKQELSSIFDLPDYNLILQKATSFYNNNIINILRQMQGFENSEKLQNSINECLDTFTLLDTHLTNLDYESIYTLLNEFKLFTKPAKADEHFKFLHTSLKEENLVKLKSFYTLNNEETLSFINNNYHNTTILLKYTKLYQNYLSYEKQKTGLLEFNDLEQYLINLLYQDDKYSNTSLHLKTIFNEIMIDEYQDTNLIQEKIALALSNGSNLFMVGDLKQSIYRFRNATSQLFSDKYALYKQDASLGTVIDLSFNFRSKNEVLETVNFIFKSTFSHEIGGIDYDEHAQLNFKNEKLNEITGDFTTQYFLNTNVDSKKNKLNYQASITMMLEQINTLINKGIQYKQICILFKNRTNIELLEDALIEQDIPFMLHTNSGFYSSYEIKDIINLLKTLSNPYDDIALLGSLHSYFFNFDEQDLLELSLIDQPNYYLKLKHSNFNEAYTLLNNLVNQAKTLNPLALINEIYETTPYQSYITNHHNYEQFLINITTFKNILNNNLEYYNSLSLFLEVLTNNIARNFDESQPAILSSKQNVINLMTIHKSKGLEFDYVFLFDNSKINFDTRNSNLSSYKNNLVISHFDYTQKIKGYKDKKALNPLFNLISFENKKDIISEELRVLYVALTRAKLQLYIFDNIKEEDLLNQSFKASLRHEDLLSTEITFNYKRMLEAVSYSFIRHYSGISLHQDIPINISTEMYHYYEPLFKVNKQEIEVEKKEKKMKKKKDPYQIKVIEQEHVKQKVYTKQKASAHEDNLLDFDKITNFDSFKQGTNTHLVLELIDFKTKEYLKEIDEYTLKYKLSKNNTLGIQAFFEDKFFNVIKDNTFYKEYSFMYKDDSKLIKGIIDLYVEDDTTIYIIDYKSDKLSCDELKQHYQKQLQVYYDVFIKNTTKDVVCKIYSLYNKQYIDVI